MKPFSPDTIIEVGKFYNVPCAILWYEDHTSYVPIIGIEHSDPQFSFIGKHYHYDGRFGNLTFNGRTNSVIETNSDRTLFKFRGISVRRIKCMRLDTGLRIPNSTWDHLNWYTEWYQSMLGKSCAGKKCPHLGTDMHNINGVLVCPLHNLHGSVSLGKIIPAQNNVFYERDISSFGG